MSEKRKKEARAAEKLKGWKINLRSYETSTPEFYPNGDPVMKDGEQASKVEVVDVQENLAAMLFNTGLRLGPEELFKAKDLADKIRRADDYVLLDQIQMDRVKAAYLMLVGIPERYVEFLMRIRDAEEVPLKEDEDASA